MSSGDSTIEGEDLESNYLKLKKEISEIAVILEKYPETLRPRVFEVLLGAYTGQHPEISPSPIRTVSETDIQSGVAVEPNQPVGSETAKVAKIRKKVPDTYSIDPDLSLHGGNGAPSFQNFVEEKKPSSNTEFNAVAVYYVTRILKLPRATLKHTWTCYKDVKRRTPEHFKQSFTDTKNQKGYIKITDDFDLEISGRGENFVEHDLPVKSTPKN